jgi:hypothetical protein
MFGVRMQRFQRLTPPHGRCQTGGEHAPNYLYRGSDYSIEGCHRRYFFIAFYFYIDFYYVIKTESIV